MKSRRIKLQVRISAHTADGPLLTDDGADLLEQISAIGRLTDAARRLGMSYRHAWSLLQNLNQRTGYCVVEFHSGGVHGGGARLSEPGEALLRQFRLLQARIQTVIEQTEPLIERSLRAAGNVPTSRLKRRTKA